MIQKKRLGHIGTRFMKSKLLIAIGDNIRRFREESGWSQEHFATECNLDRSYMGRVERGEQNISMSTLVKICLGLKCNPECLLPNYFQLKKLEK